MQFTSFMLPELIDAGYTNTMVDENHEYWLGQKLDKNGNFFFLVGLTKPRFDFIIRIGCGKKVQNYLDILKTFLYLSSTYPTKAPTNLLPIIPMTKLDYTKHVPFMRALASEKKKADEWHALNAKTGVAEVTEVLHTMTDETAATTKKIQPIIISPIPGELTFNDRARTIPKTNGNIECVETHEELGTVSPEPKQDESTIMELPEFEELMRQMRFPSVLMEDERLDFDFMIDIIRPKLRPGATKKTNTDNATYQFTFGKLFQRHDLTFKSLTIGEISTADGPVLYLVFDNDYAAKNHSESVFVLTPNAPKTTKPVEGNRKGKVPRRVGKMRWSYYHKPTVNKIVVGLKLGVSPAAGSRTIWKFDVTPIYKKITEREGSIVENIDEVKVFQLRNQRREAHLKSQQP